MTGKLTVQSDGRVTGPAQIVHNTPFPCVNGRFGSGAMRGVLMHTTVSEAPSAVSWFNNPQAQASAQFIIAESGEITQMGPIGKGWMAWHAAEGNATWYGIEHADNGNPANPLTPQQITASAQLLECLSAFAGFPLQISNSPDIKGYGWHGMGGEAFGGHFNCPGDVRKAQRGEVIALAMSIRQGAASGPKRWTTAGQLSLAALAAGHLGTDAATVLALTSRSSPGAVFEPALAKYVDTVFAGDSTRCPAGVTWHYPNRSGQAASWVTRGQGSLSALAGMLGTAPSAILQVTADVAADGKLQGLAASYIDGVFSRSALHVPAGVVLMYGQQG